MSNLSEDIIRYKKGELSQKEMHLLEKRALHDPFLAEALEGVEGISADDLAADASAIGETIRNRVNRRISFFTPLRMAAGLVLITLSIFLVYKFVPRRETIALKTEHQQKESEKKPAEKPNVKGVQATKEKGGNEVVKGRSLNLNEENRKPEPKKTGKFSKTDVTLSTHQNQATQVKSAESRDNRATLGINDSLKSVPRQSLAVTESPVAIEGADYQKANEVVKNEQKVAGADLSRSKKLDSFSVGDVQPKTPPVARIKTTQRVSGRVISAEDRAPLPGVDVVVKGTTLGTTTDQNGNYSIATDLDNPTLQFSFVGLQEQEISVSGKDKVDVLMQDDISQLSEVVVTGTYQTNDERTEPVIQLAEPVGGKKAYEQYLDSNLRYPEEALKNRIKGKSRIEFAVGTDGSLNDFRVIKKLGYGCEEEIMRLVKEGPKWRPSTRDSKAIESTVRIRLRFDPEKKAR